MRSVRRLARRVPVRVTVAAVTAAVILGAHLLPDRPSDAVLLALISLAGAVIAGDTWRPSGIVSTTETERER